MSAENTVELLPITDFEIAGVAEFLTSHLNARVAPSAWTRAMSPAWSAGAPNHGFLLRSGGQIVGTYLAFYSSREINGRTEQFCNLGAWCVREDFRSHSVRLLRKLLAQKGYHFTDLSPSGNVVALNRRLKFQFLDTSTALVPNLPWPVVSHSVRVVSDEAGIERLLSGRDKRLYDDHRDLSGVKHCVLVRGSETCHVMFRRDRRKNLPLFGSILYVGNPALFVDGAQLVYRHLLTRHLIPVTLAELRIVGTRPKLSIMARSARPKMFRSEQLAGADIDYLYSELTCVAW